jgi:CHASE2 domain-containing sensor protein
MATPGNESPSWVQVALKFGFFTLRHRPWRRRLMFYVSLAAMAQLGLGLVLMGWLSQSVILFLLYWCFCAFLVCLMLLLAVYDMLAVRQEQTRELQRLREQVFGEAEELSSTTSTDADDSRDSGDA